VARGEARQLGQEHKHRISAVNNPRPMLVSLPRINHSQRKPRYLHGGLFSTQRASCGPNPTRTVESLGFSRTMKDKCSRPRSRLQSLLARQFIFPLLLCPAIPVELAVFGLISTELNFASWICQGSVTTAEVSHESKVHAPPLGGLLSSTTLDS